jgi:hypothetical protein
MTTEVTYDNYVNYLEMQFRYLPLYDSVICVPPTGCISSLSLRIYLYVRHLSSEERNLPLRTRPTPAKES